MNTLEQLDSERDEIKAELKLAQKHEDYMRSELEKFTEKRRELESKLAAINAKITLHSSYLDC